MADKICIPHPLALVLKGSALFIFTGQFYILAKVGQVPVANLAETVKGTSTRQDLSFKPITKSL